MRERRLKASLPACLRQKPTCDDGRPTGLARDNGRRRPTLYLLALAMAAATLAGCASARVTSTVSDANRDVLAEYRARGSDRPRCVVLETRFGHARRRALARDLERTRLFREVLIDNHPGVEDWAVEILSRDRSPGGVPFWTIATLGIVPTVYDERVGYRLRISNEQLGSDDVVDVYVETIGVFGWLGIPLNLVPGWWVTSPESRADYVDAFAAPLAIGISANENRD